MKKAGLSIRALYHKTPILVFIGSVALMIILFYVLYRNAWVEEHLFTPLVNFYATISGGLLTFFGYSNTVSGDMIHSQQLSVAVKKGCDALEPMAIFAAGVVAFPAGLKPKLTGIGIGLAILFVLNIIRIISLYITGIHFPALFEPMHLAVWQVVFIIIAIILWFLWLRHVVHKTASK